MSVIDDTGLIAKLAESLREALGASSAAAELLSDRLPDDDPSLTESLAVVRHGQFMLRLISEQLADVASMREGGGRLESASVDAARLCADLADSVSAFVSSKGVSVRFVCSRASGRVVLDPVKIERMLTELLSNAVSHSMPGSAVTLALDSSDSELTFSVSDSGSGGDIEPGLGLTAAEFIARLHGGSLRVDSSPEGTTVTVTLPADRSELLHLESGRGEYLSSAQSRMLTGLSRVLSYKYYMPPYL